MKRFLIAATLAAAALSTPAAAQVSVSIGQPGFYGRIDIGGYPAPALIYPEPMIIRPAPVAVAPLYLRVPTVSTHPEFIAGLARVARMALERDDGAPAPDGGKRICPGSWSGCPCRVSHA